MRFVSKNSNLRIVLEPGLSAQPLSGFQGKQPVYIKFENGVVDVKDENLIQKMLLHRAYTHDNDYIAVGEDGLDPFIDRREEIEPTHIHTNIKYGHVEASSTSPLRKTKVNPELKKLVNDLAMKQMQEMLPGLVANGVKQVLATIQAEAKSAGATQVAPMEIPTPVGEEEETEEDYAGLTVEDFEGENDADNLDATDVVEDPNANTDAPGGIKLTDLSPEAAEAASAILGNKKTTPRKPGARK